MRIVINSSLSLYEILIKDINKKITSEFTGIIKEKFEEIKELHLLNPKMKWMKFVNLLNYIFIREHSKKSSVDENVLWEYFKYELNIPIS